MKFSIGWLKDHLKTDASVDEITSALTDLGLEVDSVKCAADDVRHLKVGENVIANAQSGIVKNVKSGSHVMGMPAVDHKNFNKSYAIFLKLDELRKKILSFKNK